MQDDDTNSESETVIESIGSIESLLRLMQSHGATRFYAKKLSPNDNSKNQIYLGSGFSALHVIPHQSLYLDESNLANGKVPRTKADVAFSWVDGYGRHAAPNVQLILYPEYPEVRMSGLLKGCRHAPSTVIASRDKGRVLFLGITAKDEVMGYAVAPSDPLSKELHAIAVQDSSNILIELFLPNKRQDTRLQLLDALKHICKKNWIASQKLGKNGVVMPYSARNGGGYTLEAELGIFPNGYSEPDYLGWEIKQYAVNNFREFKPKSPVTLMTPEPTGGVYCDKGVPDFLRRFGYPDKSGKIDRINFGGIYTIGRTYHADTGLRLALDGYNQQSGKITDMAGCIFLETRAGEIAASWSFNSILNHWNRKHAQAAYIPSLFRTPPSEYAFGCQVLLCEETDFLLFLKAVATGTISYDPAIKMEKASSPQPVTKRRSQFRVKHDNLTNLYYKHETVDLV